MPCPYAGYVVAFSRIVPNPQTFPELADAQVRLLNHVVRAQVLGRV
jgi:hypothetical protein